MKNVKLDKETSNALIEAINNSEPPLVINDEKTALAFVEAIEESEKEKLR